MNQLDVLLLVLLLPFTFRGYSRGFCREAFGLAGSIAGVLAAGAVGPAAAKVLPDERLAPPGPGTRSGSCRRSSTHDGSHPRRGDPHRARARQPERGGLRRDRAPPPRPQRGRALPVPRREDALVHGERGSRLLPLLRLRRARRRVRLRDEDPIAHLPRGGAPGRRPLRRVAAGGGGGARPAPRAADRGERGGGGVLPGDRK